MNDVRYDLDYKDITLVPRKCIVSSREEVDVSANLGKFLFRSPLVMANMSSISNLEICKEFHDAGWFYVYPRSNRSEDTKAFIDYCRHSDNAFKFTSISIGTDKQWLDLVLDYKDSIDYVTVDVAHSYNDRVGDLVKEIKDISPDIYLIVGNGSTAEWALWLDDLGVDCIKVGIGVSPVCRTRQYTGFGSHQFSSILSIASVVKNAKIMADGGLTLEYDHVHGKTIVHYGDVAKAIVAGADFVMSGSIWARCKDNPAYRWGYYGNASVYNGSKRVEGDIVFNEIEEDDLLIMAETRELIINSLQSSVSYGGGNKLYDLKNVEYIIKK